MKGSKAETYAAKDAVQQARDWSTLRAEMERLDDMDEATILGTLEGETNLLEAIAIIDEFILDAEADEAGAAAVIKRIQDRKERAARRQDRLRAVVTQAMDVAGLKTAKTAGGTYTIRATPPAPIVEDESQIPAAYFKPQEPKLDKKAVNEAVTNGETIPGVRMSNGGISLTIRRS